MVTFDYICSHEMANPPPPAEATEGKAETLSGAAAVWMLLQNIESQFSMNDLARQALERRPEWAAYKVFQHQQKRRDTDPEISFSGVFVNDTDRRQIRLDDIQEVIRDHRGTAILKAPTQQLLRDQPQALQNANKPLIWARLFVYLRDTLCASRPHNDRSVRMDSQPTVPEELRADDKRDILATRIKETMTWLNRRFKRQAVWDLNNPEKSKQVRDIAIRYTAELRARLEEASPATVNDRNRQSITPGKIVSPGN
jgi:hypothetical protein